jgi:hypothetical protein
LLPIIGQRSEFLKHYKANFPQNFPTSASASSKATTSKAGIDASSSETAVPSVSSVTQEDYNFDAKRLRKVSGFAEKVVSIIIGFIFYFLILRIKYEP